MHAVLTADTHIAHRWYNRCKALFNTLMHTAQNGHYSILMDSFSALHIRIMMSKEGLQLPFSILQIDVVGTPHSSERKGCDIPILILFCRT